jgi:hypothetical protein
MVQINSRTGEMFLDHARDVPSLIWGNDNHPAHYQPSTHFSRGTHDTKLRISRASNNEDPTRVEFRVPGLKFPLDIIVADTKVALIDTIEETGDGSYEKQVNAAVAYLLNGKYAGGFLVLKHTDGSYASQPWDDDGLPAHSDTRYDFAALDKAENFRAAVDVIVRGHAFSMPSKRLESHIHPRWGLSRRRDMRSYLGELDGLKVPYMQRQTLADLTTL